MITNRMSVREIAQELTADIKNLSTFIDYKESKIRKALLKTTSYPYTAPPLFYKSKMNNNYILLFRANNKREAKDKTVSNISIIATHVRHKGLEAIVVRDLKKQGEMGLGFFTAHFFSRYATRLGLDMHGKQLIAKVFTDNLTFVGDRKLVKDGDYSSWKTVASLTSGYALGDFVLEDAPEDTVLYKTFITKDMVREDQHHQFSILDRERIEDVTP